MVKRYAIIGAAGYVAPRHMKAIHETGGELIAALDPHDNVGILDKYFPNCNYFREFERFDRYLARLKRERKNLDYLVVCSPNYLHDAHCRYGIRNNIDVICEKPLALRPWNVNALNDIVSSSQYSIFTVMQLRLHPAIQALKTNIAKDVSSGKIHNINLKYTTSRGNWYHHSWKGDQAKSGGLLMNIGVHFFDMLIWIFGDMESYNLESLTTTSSSGILRLKNARVKWNLSIEKGLTRQRSLTVDDKVINFTDGFEDLHTTWYKNLNQGRLEDLTLDEINKSISLIYEISNPKEST